MPLFVGIASGHLVEGVAVSSGALLVGLTDSGAPYRSRVRAMLLAAVGAAVATFVGEVTGAYDVLAVAVLAVWTFAAGMTIALGLPAYLCALISPLAMVVVADYPADAAHSLERGALVLLGGLCEIVLVLVVWRARPRRPERIAIAKLYRTLARWVRNPLGDDDRVPILVAFEAARTALAVGEGNVAVPGAAGEAFRVLVDEADRAYADLVVLRHADAKLRARDATVAGAFAVGRAAAGDALEAIAEALESGRWRADADSLRAQLNASFATLRAKRERMRAAGEDEPAAELDAILGRGASVRGALRAAIDLADSWQGQGTPPDDPVRHERRRPSELRAHRAIPILRANLTTRSSAFRHAVRLTVTVTLAAALYRVLELPHGYWVPLTALWMLRPDFGSTFTRGLQRYIGTVLGAVLATVLAAALHPGPYTLAAFASALSVGIFAFLQANYALATIATSAWVVFVAALAGIPEFAAALDRLLDTAVGATLALAVYALWPTWERSTVPAAVANVIDGDRVYLRAVLEGWLERWSLDRDALRRAPRRHGSRGPTPRRRCNARSPTATPIRTATWPRRGRSPVNSTRR